MRVRLTYDENSKTISNAKRTRFSGVASRLDVAWCASRAPRASAFPTVDGCACRAELVTAGICDPYPSRSSGGVSSADQNL